MCNILQKALDCEDVCAFVLHLNEINVRLKNFSHVKQNIQYDINK